MGQYVIVFLQVFFATATHFYVAKNISKISFTYFESIFFLIMSMTLAIISYSINMHEVFVGLCYSFQILLVLFIKSHSFILTLPYTIISSFLILTINNFVGTLIFNVIGIGFNDMRNNNITYFISMLIVAAMSYLLSLFIGKLLHKLIFENINETRNVVARKGLLLSISLISLLFLLFFYINTYYSTEVILQDDLLYLNTLLSAIVFIALTIIVFAFNNILIKNAILEHKDELLHNLQSYNLSIENLYDEFKSFKHDYKNMLTAIEGFIINKDYMGLEEYILSNTISMPLTNLIHNDIFIQLDKLMLPSLKGLFLIKLLSAIENRINVIIEVEKEINNINMDIVDITRLIGIFLDNAIDECKGMLDTKIKIIIYEENSNIIILIVNTIGNNPIGISDIFEKYISSKGENRGMGLYNAQKIVAKYDSICLNTYIKEQEFHQKLIIVK